MGRMEKEVPGLGSEAGDGLEVEKLQRMVVTPS
jgi:hypothetical protein